VKAQIQKFCENKQSFLYSFLILLSFELNFKLFVKISVFVKKMISVSTLRSLYEKKKYDDFIRTINEHFDGPDQNDFGNSVKLLNLVTFDFNIVYCLAT